MRSRLAIALCLCVPFGRTAEYPDVEEMLYEEYRRLRQCGLTVMGWWFRMRGQQLLKSMSPGSNLNFQTCGLMNSKNAAKSVYMYAVLHTKLR